MVLPIVLKKDLLEVLTDPRGICDPPGNLLGTYTDKSKNVTPAIFVAPVPESYAAAGLECVISLVPEVNSFVTHGYRYVHREEEHTVYLIQHPNHKHTLPQAVERLSLWSPSMQAFMLPYSDSLDIISQAVIKLKTFELKESLTRFG